MSKICCRPVTFGASTEPGSPYSKFKDAIKKGYNGEHFQGQEELAVEIFLYLKYDRLKRNRNDLDNFIKPIIDALAEKNVLEEINVAKIVIERIKVEKD